MWRSDVRENDCCSSFRHVFPGFVCRTSAINVHQLCETPKSCLGKVEKSKKERAFFFCFSESCRHAFSVILAATYRGLTFCRILWECHSVVSWFDSILIRFLFDMLYLYHYHLWVSKRQYTLIFCNVLHDDLGYTQRKQIYFINGLVDIDIDSTSGQTRQ